MCGLKKLRDVNSEDYFRRVCSQKLKTLFFTILLKTGLGNGWANKEAGWGRLYIKHKLRI